MLIPLICSQCGGKLEVEDALVHQADEIVVVLPDQMFVCPHCGMEYLSGAKAKCTPKTVNVSAGGVFIGGNITASKVMLGDKIITERSAPQPVSDDNSKKREQTSKHVETEMKMNAPKKQKKWWRFWNGKKT